MGPLASLCYAIVAYLAGMAALVYLVGFVGNLVPKAIDGAAAMGGGVGIALDLALIAAFGVQHSAMARQAFKRRWTRVVPAVVERSTYVLATAIVLAVVMRSWQPIAEPRLWVVAGSFADALRVVFWLGWALAVVSTFLIDHFDLFGVARPLAALRARTAAAPEFRTPLLYRYVRHPLYLGLLLAFWAAPVMTAGHALFAAGMTAYILVGVALEERDLVALFGDRYREYRGRVGMLFPWRSERT